MATPSSGFCYYQGVSDIVSSFSQPSAPLTSRHYSPLVFPPLCCCLCFFSCSSLSVSSDAGRSSWSPQSALCPAPRMSTSVAMTVKHCPLPRALPEAGEPHSRGSEESGSASLQVAAPRSFHRHLLPWALPVSLSGASPGLYFKLERLL